RYTEERRRLHRRIVWIPRFFNSLCTRPLRSVVLPEAVPPPIRMAMGGWDRWFPAFSTMLLTILRCSLRLSSVYRRPMVCIRLVSPKGLREWMKEPPFFHGNKEKALQNHLFHLGRQEFP